MDVRKIVVVVEDEDAARTALEWALHNLIRCGDIITLLHVYHSPRSRNRKSTRLLRLQGFQLALSFKDMCSSFPNTKVEIVVTEGDLDGRKVAATVREVGAEMLVLGLHDRSFIYNAFMARVAPEFKWDPMPSAWCWLLQAETLNLLALAYNCISGHFNCRVIAIKQPPPSHMKSTTHAATVAGVLDSSTSMDFSQIDLSSLDIPETLAPKVRYRICPRASAICWR